MGAEQSVRPKDESFRSGTVRLARTWGSWGLVVLLVSLGLFCIAAAAAGVSPIGGIAGAGALLAWLAGVFVGDRIGGRRRPERGELSVDATGVRWDDALLVPRDKITRALVVPTAKGVAVQVQTRGHGSFALQVADVTEGEALVRALGFGVEARRLDASMVSAIGYGGFTYPLALLAAFTMAGMGSYISNSLLPNGPLLAIGVLASVVAMFTVIFWPTRLCIGADGILVKWMWRERLLRYDEIERIEHDAWGGVVLVRRDGTRFGIGQISRYGLQVEAVSERIREAMSLHASPGRAVAQAALARAGRTVPAWLDALRQLERAAEGGLRVAPVQIDDLWQVLEDPGADDGARAGAAAALHVRQLAPTARARLRVAAETVAAPRLRIAIEAAADGDDERLAEALEAVEAIEATAVRPARTA